MHILCREKGKADVISKYTVGYPFITNNSIYIQNDMIFLVNIRIPGSWPAVKHSGWIHHHDEPLASSGVICPVILNWTEQTREMCTLQTRVHKQQAIHHKGHEYLFQVFDNGLTQGFVSPNKTTWQLLLWPGTTKQQRACFCAFAVVAVNRWLNSFLEESFKKCWYFIMQSDGFHG